MAEYRLWPSTDGPGSQVSDTENYTLGVEFYASDTDCTLTKIHFWASAEVASSDHVCRLYQVGNATPIADGSGTFASPLAAGWNTVTLATPVPLTQNTKYVACVYFTTNNGYTATGSYWTSGAGASGITNGPLVAPESASASGPGQGCFKVGSDALPDGTFSGGNYWVDVTVDDGAGGTTAAAENASGTGTANNAATAVVAAAGHASGAGTANDATVSTGAATTATAEHAAGTGAANNATPAVAPAPATAEGVGAANTASAAITPPAGHASGSGAANSAAPSVAPNPATATGTGTANDATVATSGGSVTATAGHASGTGTAYDATVSTTSAAAPGSWGPLLALVREARGYRPAPRPVACPNDGEPLELVGGRLHCRYDGWTG